MKRWWQPSREERLNDELQYHVDRQYDDYVREGLSPEEARRRVAREFGPMDLAREECREVSRWHWLETTWRDIRFGLRALARERLFTAGVTSILTLGIGTAVAMFSVLLNIVLRPLPYAQPHELAVLATQRMLQNQFEGTSGANFVDWRQRSRSFANMTLYRRVSASQVVFAGADAAQRAQEGLVDAAFFGMIGARTLIGRTFTDDESARGERVVVLGEGLWREQFGGSEDVLGRTLTIAGTPHTIVGVMPRSFQLPTADTRLWRPLAVNGRWPALLTIRDSDQFEVLGRLRSGVGIDAARAELAGIAQALRDEHGENRDLDVRVTALRDHVVAPSLRRGVWLAFGAVLSLLAIAAANAGGLLAARAARRHGELAVRSALGASRARILRQLLAEHLTLWVAVSTAALLLAAALIQFVRGFGPAGLARLEDLALDPMAMTVGFAAGLVVVMLCGIVPALVASRVTALEAFRSRAGGSSRSQLQRFTVTAQIAGATTLAIAAVLLAQSFFRVLRQPTGYPAAHLLVARIDRPASPRFFLDARDRLQALPGVAAVGGITDFFIRRAGDQAITIEGRNFADADGRRPRFVLDSVTPGYFAAMGIAVIDGRDFDDRDVAPGAAPAVIVSRAVAQRFWPGESAVGQRVAGGAGPPADGRWSTVVGVVDDLRRERLDAAPVLAAYVPLLLRSMDMTIRVTGDAASLIPMVRRELRALDPSLPIPSVVTAERRLGQQLGARRFQTQALVLFAALALAFAAAGLYAALAYQVALRRREIGIRTALGASRRAIQLLFLRGALSMTVAGAAIGTVTAVLLARVLQSVLYETPAIDVRSYVVAVVAVAAASALAASWPARQASKIDPLEVLRDV
jgi:putative ABC transport system permease protein